VVKRIRLALIFGGQSAEHEVSLASARSAMGAVDPARYEVLPIAITGAGEWLLGAPAAGLLDAAPTTDGVTPSGQGQGQGDAVEPSGLSESMVLSESMAVTATQVARALSPTGPRPAGAPIDVVFPLLHGPHGEDGTVQGLLELAGVPYVGAGVAASAVGMDKILMKNLFRQAGLPVIPFVEVKRAAWRSDPSGVAGAVAETIGYPCFVKPANMGSSIGISPVANPEGLAGALDEAARYDRKLVVERAVPRPRELECGVLGNDALAVSVVGEIGVRDAAFYDYDAKYQPGASDLIVPAELPRRLSERVRDLARRAFLAVDAAGMARVDFLLGADDDLYISEINTIPGFTPTSMFPLLWAASGLPYPALIDRLVELAIERRRDV